MNVEIDVREILPIASQRAHLWVIGMEQLWNRGAQPVANIQVAQGAKTA